MSGESDDDGSPYGAESARNQDAMGATRVPMPFDPRDMRPGPERKFIPKAAVTVTGSMGRAPAVVDRPVALTPIDFDPRISAPIGAAPTRLNYDPLDPSTRGSLTRDLAPEHVVMGRLKSVGVEEWMIQWVYGRGQRGIPTSLSMLKQTYLLAHYGDALAPRLLAYMQKVNASIDAAHQAASRSQAAQAARMGVRYR